MAGHSQFKNIMVRKGRQDAKRAKVFTKVTREIISAAKSGMPDPAANPRLRSAIQWAREENMPRDRIDAAIKRGAGGGSTETFESIRYEGYGPAGVAVIVQVLTDNKNRTAPEMRSAFSKANGALGESGSVSFMFDYVGLIRYPISAGTEEKMFEAALEAGASNCESGPEGHLITCAQEDFGAVRDGLEKAFGVAESAKLAWVPKNTVEVNEDNARTLLKLIDTLEDNDDVQEVFSNFEIPEAILAKLSA
ncbi:MAG: YebC/PmpR family DNA-binding transcriptional regulator [Rickettsiales bacterium]|nr:YebC/PmpR family DNA-binding transcriptional regulator [Rickettsiales bacterium]